MASAVSELGTTPRDPVTGLQHAVTDLCSIYATALGQLQSEADKLLQNDKVTAHDVASSSETMAHGFGTQVVQAHRSIDHLAMELEHAHRTEEEQLRVLAELQARHVAVTEELRAETVAAEAVHTRVCEQLDGLVDGILETNAAHRVANTI